MCVIAVGDMFFVAVGFVAVTIAITTIVVSTAIVKPWLQATMAGVRLPVLAIIGMHLRRTPVNAMVRYLVMARQGGVSVTCAEMERAYIQGVDLEKVTLAAIHGARQGKDLTFDDLVASAMEDRLQDKLGM